MNSGNIMTVGEILPTVENIKKELFYVGVCIPAVLPEDCDIEAYYGVKRIEIAFDLFYRSLQGAGESVKLNYEEVLAFIQSLERIINASKMDNVLSLHKEMDLIVENEKDGYESLAWDKKVIIFKTFLNNIALLSGV